MSVFKECGSFIFFEWICVLAKKINVPHGGDISEHMLISVIMFVVF